MAGPRASGYPFAAMRDVALGDELLEPAAAPGIAAQAHDVVPIAAGKTAKKSRVARARKRMNG